MEDLRPLGNGELEERGWEIHVRFDVDETGSRHVANRIEDICLDHLIGFLIYGQN
jgi:hypothetical protein